MRRRACAWPRCRIGVRACSASPTLRRTYGAQEATSCTFALALSLSLSVGVLAVAASAVIALRVAAYTPSIQSDPDDLPSPVTSGDILLQSAAYRFATAPGSNGFVLRARCTNEGQCAHGPEHCGGSQSAATSSQVTWSPGDETEGRWEYSFFLMMTTSGSGQSIASPVALASWGSTYRGWCDYVQVLFDDASYSCDLDTGLDRVVSLIDNDAWSAGGMQQAFYGGGQQSLVFEGSPKVFQVRIGVSADADWEGRNFLAQPPTVPLHGVASTFVNSFALVVDQPERMPE